MGVVVFAFAGVDAHHGWRGFLRRGAQTADRPGAMGRRRGLQQGHARQGGLGAAQPFGLQSGHHEPNGQQNGDPLRK